MFKKFLKALLPADTGGELVSCDYGDYGHGAVPSFLDAHYSGDFVVGDEGLFFTLVSDF